MIKHVIILVIILQGSLAAIGAEAWGRLAREEIRITQLIGVCQHYAAQNNGQFPENLEQIRNLIDLPSLLDVNQELGAFGERHSFVKGKFHILGLGNVITLGSRPDYKYSGAPVGAEGRVVGYIDGKGVASAYWLEEKEIQRLLKLNPEAQLLPPMGPIPAPTIPIKVRDELNEHHLRVLEHYGIKLKTGTETAATAPSTPTPALIENTPAASADSRSVATSIWLWLVGAFALLAGLGLWLRQRHKK